MAAALVAGALVWSAAERAGRHQEQWGASVSAWRLTDDAASGAALTAELVERVALPAVAVPPGAVPGHDDPVGRRLRTDGHAGEVILTDRLAPGGASPIASRLTAGERGVVVPSETDDPFALGDRVDVVELVGGRHLVRDAVIVGAGERSLTVGVATSDVGAVVAALAAGGVALVLAP